jgi:hypothetical protein
MEAKWQPVGGTRTAAPVVDRGGRMGGVGAAADAGGEGDSLLSAGGA